jgi:hypothetical protein
MYKNKTTKKPKLLITGLLACSFLMAQNNPINDFVQIDFPKRTVKLSKEELRTIIDKRELGSSMLYLPIDTNGQYYSIDSILLTLHGERWQAPKNYLQNQQKSFKTLTTVDGMTCDCTSQIKTINNYSALITNIDSKDWGVYFFFSVSTNNNAVLNGSLFYFKSGNDKAKALKVVEELLDNITYKL